MIVSAGDSGTFDLELEGSFGGDLGGCSGRLEREREVLRAREAERVGEASRATRLVLVDWADADGVARELGGCPAFLGRYRPFFSRGCCDFGDIQELQVSWTQ